AYLVASAALLVWVQGDVRFVLAAFGGWSVVLAWWLSLRPSNQRRWQPDVAETPWVEVDGDVVTIHNLRNCEYRTCADYTPRWETRRLTLSNLRGIDVFLSYWGSQWIAHPIMSFDFGAEGRVAMSVETRKE